MTMDDIVTRNQCWDDDLGLLMQDPSGFVMQNDEKNPLSGTSGIDGAHTLKQEPFLCAFGDNLFDDDSLLLDNGEGLGADIGSLASQDQDRLHLASTNSDVIESSVDTCSPKRTSERCASPLSVVDTSGKRLEDASEDEAMEVAEDVSRSLTGVSKVGMEKMEKVVKCISNSGGKDWEGDSIPAPTSGEEGPGDQKFTPTASLASSETAVLQGTGGSRSISESTKCLTESGKQENCIKKVTNGKSVGSSQVGSKNPAGNGNGRRKTKVDWSPELHRRFVVAVEQLGVDKAIPSRILELMNVKCLTRYNVASHLQKYRTHRRHLIARDAEAASWHQAKRDSSPTGPTSHPPIQPRPVLGVMPAPPPPIGHPISVPMHLPCAPNHSSPAVGMPLYAWGHPTMDHSPPPMWQQHIGMPAPPGWYAPDGSMWQYPTVPMDPWGQSASGTPYYPPHMRYNNGSQPANGIPANVTQEVNCNDSSLVANITDDEAFSEAPYSSLSDDLDLMLDVGDLLNIGEQSSCGAMLEDVISEALANPQSPPPLGLKLPSVENVMDELNKQGILKSNSNYPSGSVSSESLETLMSNLSDDGSHMGNDVNH